MKIKTIVLLCLAISSSAFANSDYIKVEPVNGAFPATAYYGQLLTGCYRVTHNKVNADLANLQIKDLTAPEEGRVFMGGYGCQAHGHYPICQIVGTLPAGQKQCFFNLTYTTWNKYYQPHTPTLKGFNLSFKIQATTDTDVVLSNTMKHHISCINLPTGTPISSGWYCAVLPGAPIT